MSVETEKPKKLSDSRREKITRGNNLIWRKKGKELFSTVVEGYQFKACYLGYNIEGKEHYHYRCQVLEDGVDPILTYFHIDKPDDLVDLTLRELHSILMHRDQKAVYEKIKEQVVDW